MGAQWTNKYAILRDLSFAQGRKVPGELVASSGNGEKPPPINIVEDTEEEYLTNYVGEGELHTKPDLSMIKQLLDEVHADEIGADDLSYGDSEKVLELSKLNPLSKEFLPITSEAGDTIKKSIAENNKNSAAEIMTEKLKANTPKKKRHERNVAILSLLEKEHREYCSGAENPSSLLDEELQATNKGENSEVKLLKPNDFILDKTVTESVDKVTEWLQMPDKCQSPKAEPIALPASMFKRKKQITPILETTSMFKRKSDTSSAKSFDSDSVQGQSSETIVQSCNNKSNNLFVPSAHANEYYQKFVERSKVQQLASEDLWERAQREMKEIEAKKLKSKQERMALHQVQTTTEEQPNSNAVIPEGATSENETPPSLLADVRGD